MGRLLFLFSIYLILEFFEGYVNCLIDVSFLSNIKIVYDKVINVFYDFWL